MAVNKTPHILLLGGGYTLQRLAARLAPASFVITSRNSDQCEAWRARGWIAHQATVEEKASLESIFATYPAIDVVVDSVPPLRSATDPAAGVKNVVTALKEAPQVKRILYLSTTGVFGIRDGSIVTEETPPQPWNSQGEARLLSELAYRESGREVVAFRLPAIYGPDRGVHISIRNGTYRMVGDGSMWSNRIHVDDLVTAIEKAISAPALPPVLCVTDDQPTQARDVAKYLCEREGLPQPGSVSEEEVLRSGGYTMLSNQRVMNSLMKKVLGIQLRYPTYKEGFFS
jgi:nucleoside-diphosphate-sugar epimerase